MDIENYSFEEFKKLAEKFHGYAAPGLLLGGYMVALAKSRLPEGTLFEAISESRKCLPDAVQLLSLCSMGNNWLKVRDLGRYAVSLYDKRTGVGVRVSVSLEKLKAWPEYYSWLMKLKPKKEQDENKLLAEIEEAGDSVCVVEDITVDASLLGHKHSCGIAICPICGEGYPEDNGPICRGCQGEDYFRKEKAQTSNGTQGKSAGVRVVPVEEAVGKKLAHDMTRIVPGEFKAAAFTAGQTVSPGDLCRLQQMGRFDVAVLDEQDKDSTPISCAPVHENEVAEAFAARMAGPGVTYELPPHEGKIDFVADCDGLLTVDYKKLERFNLVPEVMCASRQDATLVHKGKKFAGTRAIPLFLERRHLGAALLVLGSEPLFSVTPLRHARFGVLVTGTEVFNGLIEDKFLPVMTRKAALYGCEVACSAIVPDDEERIVAEVERMKAQGIDLLVTTGGMSVDPGDVTRPALLKAGLTDMLYGMPALPGTMAMVGRIPYESAPRGEIQVMGVPACALFFKNTVFDLLLPRLLAGRRITRAELARMGEGGYCLGCSVCTYPKCGFGK
ncbi:MAG: trehalose-binding protein [Mailhella sp.]|nr:trehalose-binding protein [Mailhella sp.]